MCVCAHVNEKFLPSFTDETNYFYTWFFNDNILKSLPRKLNDYYVYRNGTLRLPPAEKVSGVYRCKINANETAVISESITVEYPGKMEIN